MRETPESFLSLYALKGHRKKLPRKMSINQALTRHWICLHFDLGISSLQTVRKKKKKFVI